MPCIVVDVEATCWVDRSARPRDEMEIIEIGAVRLAEDLGIVDEFSSFVRPVVHPQLTDFCTELTTITQADVDNAEPFAAVLARFLTWIGEGPHRLCSWGAYDLNQFRLDCRRAGAAFPEWFETGHVNLKAEFATWRVVKRCGMARALTQLDLPLEGTHHRGIDDARNIARIAQQVLPHVGRNGLSFRQRIVPRSETVYGRQGIVPRVDGMGPTMGPLVGDQGRPRPAQRHRRSSGPPPPQRPPTSHLLASR